MIPSPYMLAAKVAAIGALLLTLTAGYYTIQGLRGKVAEAEARADTLGASLMAYMSNADRVAAIITDSNRRAKTRAVEAAKLREVISDAKTKPVPQACVAACDNAASPIARGIDWMRDHNNNATRAADAPAN